MVLATVKGDIHDIGKNIVAIMLKNYGFEVIDLGKNISSEDIIEAADKNAAGIIGLSALMTTTMPRMAEVVRLAREQKLQTGVIVGGAAVTKKYAEDIGADGYGKDAVEAVKVVKELVNS